VQVTTRTPSRMTAAITALLVVVSILAGGLQVSPAEAQDPPFDGNPISPGLGPTYGEGWCASPAGESVPQTAPLAIIPYAAITCTLELFEAEAAANGVPDRFDWWSLGENDRGRDIWAVVVNAVETPEQQRDYERWLRLREVLLSDPHGAQSLLEEWGSDVKMPVFIEANIHGGEREGTDAIMQVIRDLTTLPRGYNEVVDRILDNAIVAIIPVQNPDGRIAGTRANANGLDMNRDLMVQSQREIQLNVGFQQEYLAPVMLALHGYVNPTLVDGQTKPHNFGYEYDVFLGWNQQRLDANESALSAVGMGVTRPVNQWNASGGGTSGNPAIAQGWDDWGPFYTQTYGAFLGVDGSTWEICSGGAGCTGRFGSKRSAYLGFYSSTDFWVDNKADILWDQAEVFRRGADGEARPNCCEAAFLVARGFDEANHNWMEEYPKAYVIPFVGGPANVPSPFREVQRSDAEANRLAQFLVDNGIEVRRANQAIVWQGTTYPRHSYVVWMDQPLRGLAENFLGPGVDISDRITQLYAPPGAWSHITWGADVVRIPADDASFAPRTVPFNLNPLMGGVRGGGADWYSLEVDSPTAVRAVNALLQDGVTGEVAEEPFESTSAGSMPAGTLLFPNDAATTAKLADVGATYGLWFERSRGPKPETTALLRSPRIAVLASGATSDTWFSLRDLGFDAVHVPVTGTNSINTAAEDPLLGFDVLYNSGTSYPTGAANATARERIAAFFERGGGYVGSLNSGATFLVGAGQVSGLTYASQAGSGIARWDNTGGMDSPVTGALPSQGYLYHPSPMSRHSAVPADATVAGRFAGTPSESFVAGLWRSRSEAFTEASVIAHGETSVGARWAHFASNPFSRADAEGMWPAVGSAAFWSNLTDE
jgi:hypothetical protein